MEDKEIISGKECIDLLREGINELADTVCLTMGPYGHTVGLTSGMKGYATKDGVSIAKEVFFKDPVKDFGAQMVKEVAELTVELAGDGTTTATCLAQALINSGFDLMAQGISLTEIKSELDRLEVIVINDIKRKIRQVKPSKIYQVATIAANGDSEIGNLIQEAYNNSKIVKVEESNKEVDELISLNGMRLDTGYFDKSFINNAAKQSIEYTDIPVIIVDGHLTDLKPIAKLIEGNPQGIAIIADHFTDNVVSLLRDNFNKGLLNVALIKSPGFATHRKDLLRDIATFTHGEVINPNKMVSITTYSLGLISSLKVTGTHTIITKDSDTGKASDLADELRESLKDLESTAKVLLQQRIDNLSGSISIIKVGGKSELEMKERKDRIDDAVLAVGCALEEGIIEGAGKSLWLASPIVGEMFKSAIKAPYSKIVENGSDSKLYMKDLFKEGIVDPYKVTRIALQNAISVAKVILSTKAVVINPRLWR